MSESGLPKASCDGGPHMLVPAELVCAWEGVNPPSNNRIVHAKSRWGDDDAPATDYDLACDAQADVDVIPVGDGYGLVINASKLFSIWVGSDNGEGGDLVTPVIWGEELNDDFLSQLSRNLAPSAFRETGLHLSVGPEGLELFPACDSAPAWVYGHDRLRVSPGRYLVLHTRYQQGADLILEIYRLKLELGTP